jgi:hypothetical protein
MNLMCKQLFTNLLYSNALLSNLNVLSFCEMHRTSVFDLSLLMYYSFDQAISLTLGQGNRLLRT